MIDLLAKRDIIETVIPNMAVATPRTAGVSGAWSAYTAAITAAALATLCPGGFILCGMYVFDYFQVANAAIGTQFALVSIQVATGAAGAEVPIAEGHGVLAIAPGATATDAIAIATGSTVFFEPQFIPASTRLAVRATNSSGQAVYLGVYLFGYDARYFGSPLKEVKELQYIRGLLAPTVGSVSYPSGAMTNVTGNASAWVYGAATQFIASAATDLLIVGMASVTTTGKSAQAQIGIGAAGSEQWMSKVGLPVWSVAPGPVADSYLPRPLYVKQGEAVSVRVACNGVNIVIPIALKGFALK